MNRAILFMVGSMLLTGCDPRSVPTSLGTIDGRIPPSPETDGSNNECDRVRAYGDGSQSRALITADLCSSGVRIVEFYGKKAGSDFDQSAVVPAADSADFNVVLSTPGFSDGYPATYSDKPETGTRVIAILMSDLNVDSKSGRAFFCANKSICRKSDADILAKLEFD